DNHLELRVGEIELELRRMNIHSIDGCVVYLPRDKFLLAGDTLEDPLTYMIEVENLAEHLRQLKEMKGWDIAKILPDHGDPDIIRAGGYDKTLIDADRGLHHPDAVESPRCQLSGRLDGRLSRPLGGEGLDQALRALPGGARAKSQARPLLLEGQDAAGGRPLVRRPRHCLRPRRDALPQAARPPKAPRPRGGRERHWDWAWRSRVAGSNRAGPRP